MSLQYSMSRRVGGAGVVVTQNTTSNETTITGLQSGLFYVVNVQAFNNFGMSFAFMGVEMQTSKEEMHFLKYYSVSCLAYLYLY